MFSKVQRHVEKIGGQVVAVGVNKSMHIQLADESKVVAYPTMGVPTSTTLHQASRNALGQSAAVVYDPIGLHPEWQDHLDWLGSQINQPRWLKDSEVSWQLADWSD